MLLANFKVSISRLRMKSKILASIDIIFFFLSLRNGVSLALDNKINDAEYFAEAASSAGDQSTAQSKHNFTESFS